MWSPGRGATGTERPRRLHRSSNREDQASYYLGSGSRCRAQDYWPGGGKIKERLSISDLNKRDERLGARLWLALFLINLVSLYFITVVTLDGDYVTALAVPVAVAALLLAAVAIAHKLGSPVFARLKHLYTSEAVRRRNGK